MPRVQGGQSSTGVKVVLLLELLELPVTGLAVVELLGGPGGKLGMLNHGGYEHGVDSAACVAGHGTPGGHDEMVVTTLEVTVTSLVAFATAATAAIVAMVAFILKIWRC